MVRPTRLVIRLRSIDLEHDLEETDNIETINAYLDSTEEQYREFNRRGLAIVGENADIPETVDVTEEAIGKLPTAAPAPAKRGRKAKAPVEAVAPPPIPVPDAVPPAPPVISGDPGPIPAFLDRNAAPAVVAPPPPAPVAPPPVVPASPPVAPVSGPVGQLITRVLKTISAKVKERENGDAVFKEWVATAGLRTGETTEERLVNWVASANVSVPAATLDETIDVIAFTTDDRLASLKETAQSMATALGVS